METTLFIQILASSLSYPIYLRRSYPSACRYKAKENQLLFSVLYFEKDSILSTVFESFTLGSCDTILYSAGVLRVLVSLL